MLSAEELQELDDGGEVSTEDILAAQMAARAERTRHHLRRVHRDAQDQDDGAVRPPPDPDRAGQADNLPAPFHVYSMRQAIEEGFILDVLQNYTTYKLAFRLAHNGKELDDKEVERSAALKGIMGWVRLHPYNIAQKVQVVVEHFRENVAPLLNGQAKAMVVVGSRHGSGPLATRDRQIHQGSRLQDRHAGGVLGRGQGQGIRPRPVHRNQQRR